ncbi:hypothetical protein OIO90_004155 [Microbotryomycetes sp. JL221]|nr:hypothetical protein OIO90_004155 [Microbotryomycetes sp. JL221]
MLSKQVTTSQSVTTCQCARRSFATSASTRRSSTASSSSSTTTSTRSSKPRKESSADLLRSLTHSSSTNTSTTTTHTAQLGALMSNVSSTHDAMLDTMPEADAGSPLTNLFRPSPGRIIQRPTISPGHLSPQHLLKPLNQLPKSNLQKAFPLGPPTQQSLLTDPFLKSNLNPLKQGHLNVLIKNEFVTSMGKIRSRGQTQLQRSSQRKVAKSIRRARSMGIMPMFGVQTKR